MAARAGIFLFAPYAAGLVPLSASLPSLPTAPADRAGAIRHNGPVMSGKKRMQQITVGIIVGLIVVSLALTLVGSALAAPAAGGPRPATVRGLAADGQPTSLPAPGIVSTGDPKPVTNTPQGTSTQVTDDEHLGGLLAYLAFMLGGALLLVRGKHRERRDKAGSVSPESILSRP